MGISIDDISNWKLEDGYYGVDTIVSIPFIGGAFNTELEDGQTLNLQFGSDYLGKHLFAKKLATMVSKCPQMKKLLEETFVHLSKLSVKEKNATNEKLQEDIEKLLQEISV